MKRIVIVSIISFLFLNITAQDHHVRIGFLGNSITIGSGLPNALEECYPAQIGELLQEVYGDTCLIRNYAVSGRTMLKNGDFPLWDEAAFQNGWVEAPDICFILLGTNDTKPYNWDVYGHEFHPDYLAMMDTFKLRNPNVKFIVCYPPPAFDVVYDIRNEIIIDGVIPVVDTVLTERDAMLIDFYNPLLDSVYLFPDKIHPNADGAKVMAKIAFDEIVASGIISEVVTGGTFISTYKTKKKEIKQGDSTTISWETRNATSVYFDGELVGNSGSIDIAPQSTTDYWLVAIGAESTDSLILRQLVYVPELSKIKTKPTKISLNHGVEYDFEVVYYDQKNSKMLDTVFSGSWEIIEGGGSLTNERDTMVTFVASESGASQLKVVVGEFEFVAAITVREPLGMDKDESGSLKPYPNPCTSELIIPNASNAKDLQEFNVYDASGKLALSLSGELLHQMNDKLVVDTKPLHEGVYFYNLVYNDKTLNGKFIKR